MANSTIKVMESMLHKLYRLSIRGEYYKQYNGD